MRTFTSKTLLAIALFGLSAGSLTAAPFEAADPVFIESSQYTAILNQRTQNWRFAPLDGQDVVVQSANPGCATGASVPNGVWLVARDAAGNPQLVAPSTTALPVGYPESVPLVSCEKGHGAGPYVAAPQALIDWLSTRTGAVLIDQ